MRICVCEYLHVCVLVSVCVCHCEWVCYRKLTRESHHNQKKTKKTKHYQTWLPPWDPTDLSTHWVSFFHKPGLCFKAQSCLWKMALFNNSTMGLCASCLPWFQYDIHIVCSPEGKRSFYQLLRLKTHCGLEELTQALFIYNHLSKHFSM